MEISRGQFSDFAGIAVNQGPCLVIRAIHKSRPPSWPIFRPPPPLSTFVTKLKTPSPYFGCQRPGMKIFDSITFIQSALSDLALANQLFYRFLGVLEDGAVFPALWKPYLVTHSNISILYFHKIIV